MKWDPCLERNRFSITKDISYISSKIQCPTNLEIEITGSSQVVTICCNHNNSPFSLSILWEKYEGPLPKFSNPTLMGGFFI